MHKRALVARVRHLPKFAEDWITLDANILVRANTRTQGPASECGVYCGIDSTYGNDSDCSRQETLTRYRSGRTTDEAESFRLGTRRTAGASRERGDPSYRIPGQRGRYEVVALAGLRAR